MTTNSSMDQLLDLLIDALEERKLQRQPHGLAEQVQPEPEVEDSAETSTESQPISEKTEPLHSNTKLPKAWLPYAAAQNIYWAGDVTPAFIESIKQSNPNLFKKARAAHWQAMPDLALAALPASIVRKMAYSTRLEVQQRLAALQTAAPLEVADLDALEATEPELNEAESELEAALDEPIEEMQPIVLDVEDSAEIDLTTESPAREIVQDNLPRTLSRMFLGLILVVVLANIKIIDYGALNAAVGAAGNRGTERVVFARDGMLIRANDSDRVYLMENNKRRWVSTLEAFNHYGYRWGAVRVVSPEYVAQFEEGRNKDLLASCPGSPHIFTISLEAGNARSRRTRHHIRDVETFVAEGFLWEEISYNHCSLLNGTMIGESIPPEPDRVPPRPTATR